MSAVLAILGVYLSVAVATTALVWAQDMKGPPAFTPLQRLAFGALWVVILAASIWSWFTENDDYQD